MNKPTQPRYSVRPSSTASNVDTTWTIFDRENPSNITKYRTRDLARAVARTLNARKESPSKN